MSERFFGPGGPACNPGRTDARDETPSREGEDVQPRTARQWRSAHRMYSKDDLSTTKTHALAPQRQRVAPARPSD